MNDYYEGLDGARRAIDELDHLLQELLDSVGRAESLDCSIRLTVSDGDSVQLAKTYRPRHADAV